MRDPKWVEPMEIDGSLENTDMEVSEIAKWKEDCWV
jgi:hypothetical protein